MIDSLSYIRPVKCGNTVLLPIAPSKVSCGFPSAAEDWLEDRLDLNEKLIKSPSSTFLFRAEGESMTGVGINDGDILIVDRGVTPTHGRVVVATISGDLTVKRLNLKLDPPQLDPANAQFKSITEEFTIWGVVTSSITEL
ncbi:MAG: translesion error-prone DNA polymerase V autoproteolytic subunit [Kordiimonadaceae bacterium]|mgnify:FL=1|jgi:DNA polymerase V|nr:translesion error-prone DNA polymerase V autoproteolytic subunit [Kordiimonadaceae bacterium]MBT6135190.1 translesion error-prone DNA polymerase V autoproteolytic subunit [Kordiimonadaceae bacterium]MBT6467649.1 translesion error-prone DNA polymerase V autoproteolytic subunit [Kordiimonadaceae bacterium]MBT7544218.1 translesion error-prone DNA polymerase V autoproteolytic subunit [Kordiimonadaceae bacterium]